MSEDCGKVLGIFIENKCGLCLNLLHPKHKYNIFNMVLYVAQQESKLKTPAIRV